MLWSVRLHARAALEPLTRPHSEHDVDGELWLLLDIASDDELVEVYDILFGASMLHAPCMQTIQQPLMSATHRPHHAGAVLGSTPICLVGGVSIILPAGLEACVTGCRRALPEQVRAH